MRKAVGWKVYLDTLLNEEVEVEIAVKEMKYGRSTGPDETPTELWNSAGAIGIIFLCILFNCLTKSKMVTRCPNHSAKVFSYRSIRIKKTQGNAQTTERLSCYLIQ